jgi:hypothetical protein
MRVWLKRERSEKSEAEKERKRGERKEKRQFARRTTNDAEADTFLSFFSSSIRLPPCRRCPPQSSPASHRRPWWARTKRRRSEEEEEKERERERERTRTREKEKERNAALCDFD